MRLAGPVLVPPTRIAVKFVPVPPAGNRAVAVHFLRELIQSAKAAQLKNADKTTAA